MKLYVAIMLFILGLFMSLGLIYIFNYALVAQDAIMYDMISEDYLPVYRLFNMIWSAMPFIAVLYFLVKTINKEGLYG